MSRFMEEHPSSSAGFHIQKILYMTQDESAFYMDEYGDLAYSKFD